MDVTARRRDVDAMVQPVVRNLCRRLAAGDVSRVRSMAVRVTRSVGALTCIRVEFEAIVDGDDWEWTEAPPAPAATAPPSSTPGPRPARDLSGITQEARDGGE